MRKILLLPVFCSIAISINSYATQATDLKAKIIEIGQMKADFSLIVTDVNKKELQKGDGVFATNIPNQFYWHLEKPDESLIVGDGKDVWIYNPFAEEVTVMNLDRAVNASPLSLLVRDDAFGQYKITAIKDCFEIIPNEDSAIFEKMQLCFNKSSLTQLFIIDNQKNKSVFKFTNQKKLSKTDAKLFKFNLPKDVNVDDQRVKK